MTNLITDKDRRVKRKVVTAHRSPLVVTLAPDGIWIREPRRRVAYLLPYGVAFTQAVRLYVDAEKRRKSADRKARRLAK